MNTAEQVTRLENEVRDLEDALRKALRGGLRERDEAMAFLLQRDLRRAPASPSAFFDIADAICHSPFRRSI